MKLVFLYFLLLISYAVSGQELVGKWYSKDSTRIYNLYKKDDQFEAVLEKSSRKTDREGVLVLKHVTYSKKKKRYDGVIYTVTTQLPTIAKMKFEDNDGKILRLRLRRMFFMNVTIKWYRVEENGAAQL